ncbi:MAG: hypothetical protein UX78_C0002G0009 [Candidatus Amesbacteria bacterium GW2011_GWA2_47_11]|uniref:Uncharacterized protein n=4 Tax=Candidatus Amesiibacteriota TaxID=1752730 RepID=A0A0G1UKF8_9BACT|nr:MAG: hypothetical protein UX78_C0002G0009 [Candidatus Amesbacteria bacterium GW2011_GWA2_47_11]KKU94614.1 MAG: hypothetical protein UY22_C0011G0021 [Candidatus Amesbacteria bacterium GW2011_GWC1_48_10]
MVILLKSPADEKKLQNAASDLAGYVKFVVDINREIMTAGGLRHFEGEQLLLQDGSHQEDLWGGGVDLETAEVDFESIINIRPPDNPSREVLDLKLRDRIKSVVSKLFVKV